VFRNCVWMVAVVAKPNTRSEELPVDNAARIALFDAVFSIAGSERTFDGIASRDLFELLIPRLRVLVPRELHLHGESEYVDAKIGACIEAGILRDNPRRPGLLILGTEVPRIRYPDGTVRDYSPGLEPARERLDADDARLRRGNFDCRNLVRSPAKDRRSDRYRNLVQSMREHGFLEWVINDRAYPCFPIIEDAAGNILDGKAREAAAKEAGISLKKQHRVRLAARRDTPLQNTLLVLDLNAERLSDEERLRVHEEVGNRVDRPWEDVEADLRVTQEWRLAIPKEYDAKLDVKDVSFSSDQRSTVQVTTDGSRVMLRSLMRQGGIPEYRRDDLLEYIPWEKARTQHSGRQAVFVRIADAIDAIATMRHDRESRRLKVDPGWERVRSWLEEFDGRSSSTPMGAETESGMAGDSPR
jgi:hypothetical protein